MAEEHLGLSLEFVPQGDLLPALPPVPPRIAIRAADGALQSMSGIVRVAGSADVMDPDAVEVQVSLDDPTFDAANLLFVDGVASWNATWFAKGSGVHTIYARMVYAGETIAEANETVTLGTVTNQPAAAKSTTSSKTPTAGTAGVAPRTTSANSASTRSTTTSSGTSTFPPDVTVGIPATSAAAMAALLIAGAALARGRRP